MFRPNAETLANSAPPPPHPSTGSSPSQLYCSPPSYSPHLPAHSSACSTPAAPPSSTPAARAVPLQGVNLGGWLVMEPWMCPADSGGLPDTYSIIQELDSRFGVATEQSLILTYQQSWITTTDLANIKNAGFNAVRVPVWWGNFYPIANVSNATWRSDAFTELDWLVNAAGAAGLYVIIDMHGVVGGQSTSDDTGQQNQNQYWTNSNDQGNTAYMWWEIANHYNGNPTVAGYDLINEPTGTPSNSAVISAYATPLHDASAPPTPTTSSSSKAPGTIGTGACSPAHPLKAGPTSSTRCTSTSTTAPKPQVEQGSTNQVTDFDNHSSYNVPGYIGEFNDFGYGAGAWQFSTNAYNAAGLSWTMWAYKATHGLNPDSWGFYDPTLLAHHTQRLHRLRSHHRQRLGRNGQTPTSFTLNTSLGISGNQNGSLASAPAPGSTSSTRTAAPASTTPAGARPTEPSCSSGPAAASSTTRSGSSSPRATASTASPTATPPSETWNVVNNGTSNGSLIQTWTYGGGTNEQWMPVSLGNGYYKFVGVGSGRCLDIPGASTANGVQLQIYDCNGTAAQSFQLNAQP